MLPYILKSVFVSWWPSCQRHALNQQSNNMQTNKATKCYSQPIIQAQIIFMHTAWIHAWNSIKVFEESESYSKYFIISNGMPMVYHIKDVIGVCMLLSDVTWTNCWCLTTDNMKNRASKLENRRCWDSIAEPYVVGIAKLLSLPLNHCSVGFRQQA